MPRQRAIEQRPLEVVRGHQLVRFDGRTALLDTGSPTDIGRGQGLSLLGRERRPSPARTAVLDLAGTHIGARIEWLLGGELLARHRVLVDGTAGRAVFSTGPLGLRGATEVPVELVAGVPLMEISTERGPARAVLDSGAALSYAPQSVVASLTPIRTVSDFHPSIGEYRTPVFRIPVVVWGRPLVLEAGTLPQPLRAALGAISGGWIMGSDFFARRAVLLDYPGLRVLDAPSGAVLVPPDTHAHHR